MKLRNFILFLPFLLYACIGTDEVDDPIVGASVVTDQTQIAMLLGDSVMVSGTYFDQFGIRQNNAIVWESDNPDIAVANNVGTVMGLGLGQTNVFGYVGDTQSAPILTTVVASTSEPAMIEISANQGNQIEIGQTTQMTAVVTNLNGDVLSGQMVSWMSSDEDVFTIDENGLITGVSDGFSMVYGMVNGLESNRYGIIVGATSRTGTFESLGGYDASGSAELFIDDNGNLMLSLSNDFATSFANGTYIYLSNSTNGSSTASSGLEISEITTNGSALFNVSDIDPSVEISDFNFVVILCKPASLSFGFAQLN